VIVGWHAHVHRPEEAAAEARTWDGNGAPWRNAAKPLKLPTGSAAKAA
jgi:hypothetical protein